ncbi:acyl-[ACP]--phospholipid O-acyltransferase [Sulfurovum sp. NBC37-1]|uniref:acyl-[ACP]--phospholipid O-acyltransferase n=1 Tax=Sulfurovum sp. (strain NBC37-1) TaxID=387093 RepID=UPI0001587531|nr:acyl-[ACP]--phospholipid O-acyltransferase [Sulfurovum sp. NBC37-1]BAF72119.1 2-acyl-glycerophospho-ethanolamine acyltransferase; acyl-acyl-carrier protein synthetase [Sulfurovum sp. NBC37-1]
MKHLFKISGFTPYIFIILLNAMTDLGHKIILQNTIFKAYDGSELIVLTAIVNALILLPFIFLFSPAGFISDKYPKVKVVEYASAAAIGITTLILLSYYMGWFWAAFGLTFILAAQSAIYSPAKYGLIKEMTGNENLAPANALVQSVTIVSILAGAVIYSVFFESLLQDRSVIPSEILTYIAPVGYMLIGASILEYILARRLVKKVKPVAIDESMAFEPQAYKDLHYLKENLSIIRQNSAVWLSILGLSIIWGVSQVVLAIFGEYLKATLGVTDTVTAQGLLALSGLGMIAGSMVVGRVSRNYIETGIIPLGALGVTVMLFMMPTLSSLWTLGSALFLFGFSAGLFVVPLNAIIQFAAPSPILGKVLAGNNFMQNVSMFGFLILTALFGYFNLDAVGLFYIIATVSLLGMGYTFIKLPQSLVRYVVRMIIGFKYRLHVDGLRNIPADKGVLLLGNHVSFLDWAILQMAYPKQIRFVMERSYYDKWYLKPFLDFFGVIPISSRGSKGALALVTAALNRGETVALFPEGHLSRNGHLGTFQRGFEVAAKDAEDAVIIPFYLRGLWEDNFSYASNKMKRNTNKDISVTFGEELNVHSGASEVKKAVFDLSVKSWKTYTQTLPSLQKAWIRAAKEQGGKLCIADSTGVEVNGDRFVTGTLMIASALKPILKESQNIGLLLPTSVAGSMANMAILTLGKTIVNLNYSSGEASLLHALKIANITKVVASKQFVTKLKAKGFDLGEVLSKVEVIYLEDIKAKMGKVKGVFTLGLVKLLPACLLSLFYIKDADLEETAAILFSSGSEGTPKGIELSHKNMMGNIKQAITLINPKDDDVMLGTLPIFHSFGLTVTTLLPLIEGLPVVCHPDPTDGFGIGKMAAKYEATMLFATATFFRLYTRNKKLHPLMFKDLRMVIAGAEKLPQEIRDEFKKKFGHDIYEGYGATETTPVASINIPDVLMQDSWKPQIGHKIGTVGLPVPGSSFKIVDPESFEELPTGEEGMILIGGTQIMKGYIGDPEKTASVIKEIDGIRWYVTGDKGRIDEDGFLTIVDRYSRFAKVAGEMVSLGLVEFEIATVLGENDQIAVAALPDAKKGEKLVLLLEGEMEIETLKEKIKSLEMNPLFVPGEYYKVEELPKLGTGKADFKGAKSLAQKMSENRKG